MLLPTDYDQVFWTFSKHNHAPLIMRINEFFSQYGRDYMPLYLEGKAITLTAEGIKEALIRSWGREDGIATGLKSANGIVLRMTIQNKEYPNVRFSNTLSIGFDLKHLIGTQPMLTLNQLKEIFVFCARLFTPFFSYSCKSGEINVSPERQRIGQMVDTQKVPIAIEWFNYFSPEWVERFGGGEKLLAAPVFQAEPVEELGGIILILQAEPFDYTNPDHLGNRHRVEEYLELPRLHQRFQRN